MWQPHLSQAGRLHTHLLHAEHVDPFKVRVSVNRPKFGSYALDECSKILLQLPSQCGKVILEHHVHVQCHVKPVRQRKVAQGGKIWRCYSYIANQMTKQFIWLNENIDG